MQVSNDLRPSMRRVRAVIVIALALVATLLSSGARSSSSPVRADGTTTVPPTSAVSTTRPPAPPTTPPTTGPPAVVDHADAAVGRTTTVETTVAGHTAEVRITLPDGSDLPAGTSVLVRWAGHYPLGGTVESAPSDSCLPGDSFSGGLSWGIGDDDWLVPAGRLTSRGGPTILSIVPELGGVGSVGLDLQLAPSDRQVALADGQTITLDSLAPGQRAVVSLTTADGTNLPTGSEHVLRFTQHETDGLIGLFEARTFGASCGASENAPVDEDEHFFDVRGDGSPQRFAYVTPFDGSPSLTLRLTARPPDVVTTVVSGQRVTVATGPGQGAIVHVKTADGADPAPGDRVIFDWAAHYGSPNAGSVIVASSRGYALGDQPFSDFTIATGGPFDLQFTTFAQIQGTIDVGATVVKGNTTTTGVPGSSTPTTPSGPTTSGPSTTVQPSTTVRPPTTPRPPTTTAPPTTQAPTTSTTVPKHDSVVAWLLRLVLCVLFGICR